MLAQTKDEMLERARGRYEAWAKEFGFAPPPSGAGWDELKAYRKTHAEDLEHADLMSEINRILGPRA